MWESIFSALNKVLDLAKMLVVRKQPQSEPIDAQTARQGTAAGAAANAASHSVKRKA